MSSDWPPKDQSPGSTLRDTGFKNVLTIVGGVEGGRDKAVMDIGHPIIGQDHGGPATVSNCRDASFSDRPGFFKDRRFAIVPQKSDTTFCKCFLRRAGARE